MRRPSTARGISAELAPGIAMGDRMSVPKNSAGARAAGGRGAAPARPTPSSVRYVNWLPPYGPTDTKVLYEGSAQLGTIAFSADAKTMFVSDSGSVTAVRGAQRFNLGRGVMIPGGGGGFGGGGRGGPSAAGNDTTGGALQMKRGPNGQQFVVVGTDGKSVAVSGTRTPGAKWNTEGPRPWLDKLDFESGKRTRIFDAPANAYEEFVTALDDDFSSYIYTHESRTVIADAWLKDVASGSTKQLTHAVDVGPEVTGAITKRLQVTRPRDGFTMWVDVTLPRDWKPGTKLPGIIWFYPREYTTQADYERSRYTTNINKFPEVPALRPASSTKLWVAQGYALIEPDIPIVGDTAVEATETFTVTLANAMGTTIADGSGTGTIADRSPGDDGLPGRSLTSDQALTASCSSRRG